MGLVSAYYVAFIYENVVTLRGLPEIWRLVSPFFITGPKFGLLMDPYFLWTYASQLELEATRFSQPGDFFTYITFVCSVILVSPRISRLLRHDAAFLLHFLFLQKQPPLLPGQLILAETVPRWEGNYPCTVRRSSFAKYHRAFAECGHGGIPLEKAVRRDMWRNGGCWPLHLITFMTFVLRLIVSNSKLTAL
jgi:hypothetical protein